MALEKTTRYFVQVGANDIVSVKQQTVIYDDGEIVGTSSHRLAINPGDDYSSRAPIVRRVCQTVHVPTSVAAWQAKGALDEAKANNETASIPGLEQQANAAQRAHDAWLNANS
jgi:hypothetical protein